MKNISIVLITVLVVITGVAFLSKKSPSLGSVAIGSECHATTTNTWGSVTKKVLSDPNGVTFKTLCGLNITTGTAGGAFEIRDATSTTDVSSTTIATFSSTAPGGIYLQGLSLSRGLGVNVTSGNVASTTILLR
jgi:hypothetical protein